MPGKVKVYHTTEDEDGDVVREVEMYSVDATEACRKHPDEWSMVPPKKAKIVSATTGDEVTETATERADALAEAAAADAKAQKSSAKANATGLQPSSPQTTERAGPTRRDPPFTPGAVRNSAESGQGPELVTSHEGLGEVEAERRIEEGGSAFEISARDRRKASVKAKAGAAVRREARRAAASNEPAEVET